VGILFRRKVEVGVEFIIAEHSEFLRSLVLNFAIVLDWI
jgi:hypothetical protein